MLRSVRISRRATAALLAAATFGGLHCGGSVATPEPAPGDHGPLPLPDAAPDTAQPDAGPPPLPVPTNHRPAATACPTTRPAGLSSDAGVGPDASFYGECRRDADCTSGNNGRCLPPLHNGVGDVCSYDACFTDADCGPGNLCECGASLGTNGSDGTPMRLGNKCLPGNCRVDSDCGPHGYCSPTFDTTCGPYDGVQGYDCHTIQDTCTNDTDCTGTAPAGYCAWQPPLGKWACATSACAG
jgi:hypothetical protein